MITHIIHGDSHRSKEVHDFKFGEKNNFETPLLMHCPLNAVQVDVGTTVKVLKGD